MNIKEEFNSLLDVLCATVVDMFAYYSMKWFVEVLVTNYSGDIQHFNWCRYYK